MESLRWRRGRLRNHLVQPPQVNGLTSILQVPPVTSLMYTASVPDIHQ